MNYSETLRHIASAHETDSADAWVESVALREAAEYIIKLEKALEIYDKERTRFRHAHPELTGVYFIAGESGNKDANLLPDRIWICPAYGCDWTVAYERTDSISAPSW